MGGGTSYLYFIADFTNTNAILKLPHIKAYRSSKLPGMNERKKWWNYDVYISRLVTF